MSITAAAEDLCLTQSAVSRQVLALEAQLGVRLLVRSYRAVSFTPAGERLFRVADLLVQQMQEVTESLKVEGRARPVSITSSIGLTAFWLLPRLSRLRKQHPPLDVRVAANDKPLDLRNSAVDLAIRYASRDSAPPGAIRLFGETVAPVAHPSLAVSRWRGRGSLRKSVLLEFDARYPWLQWRFWLEQRGWADLSPAGVVHFNQYDHTIQAALAGQGIALGRLELIEPLLSSGQLVVLDHDSILPTPYGFWLIPAEAHPRREVRKVMRWVLDEARPQVPSGA